MTQTGFARLGIALPLLAVLSGCFNPPGFQPVSSKAREEPSVQDDPVVLAYSGLVKRAETATLYEGLPHQTKEKELLNQERQAKQTIVVDEFAYYREPLELTEADRQKIQSILSEPSSYRYWWGEKGGACCVYHPDYCLEWYAEGQMFRSFLCFGCGEAKFIGPEGTGHYNFDRAARTRLAEVLFPYRKNRPDSEGWKKLTEDNLPR